MTRIQRGRQKGHPNKVPSHAHKARTKLSISKAIDLGNYRRPLGPIGPEKLARDTRTRVINALGEMRRDPTLSFSEAARRWHLDPRTIYRYAKSALRKDNLGKVK